MKTKLRLMVGLLAVVMLFAACQPTPEEEVVTNKGDRVLEEKITAVTPTQNPTESETEETAAPVFQYTFPDRWEEVYDAGNELVLTFNADIVQKEDGVYPVYRTKAGTVDAETVQKVLNALLPAPVSMHETDMTKDDWKAEMERYVKNIEEQQERLSLPEEERGDGDDTVISQEEINEKLQWYAQQIALAPETLDAVATTEFSGLRERTGIVYELSNGEKAYVRYGSSFWLISRSGSKSGTVVPSYDRWEYEDDGEGYAWKEVTITEEEALAQGQAILDKLGFEGFALVEAYEANYSGNEDWRHPTSSGYVMKYMRSFGGYPLVTCVEPAQYFNYGDGDGFLANKYIAEEYVEIYVDENGIGHIEYLSPKEVVKQENAAVELLDFETVQEKIRKGLTYGLTGNFESVEVYRLVLTVNTQWVADSDEYYEVPCWIVYYDFHDYSHYKTEEEIQTMKERVRSPHFVMAEALYINAIDGSVIHTDW